MSDLNRRKFLVRVAVPALAFSLNPSLLSAAQVLSVERLRRTGPEPASVTLSVNGHDVTLQLEPRETLLDTLRDKLHFTGTKKGCDQGTCGACTVLVNGKRVNSCLTLAVMVQGKSVTTIEGLANGDSLHPMQSAFLEHDGFQCGYCTPGQICSAAGMLNEHKAGWPSLVADDVAAHAKLTDAEIRERMSGNICRCSAYPNIVAAIRDAAGETL
jgi:xanthine dehydrogenase YagT iron-sulfur-binding subunit